MEKIEEIRKKISRLILDRGLNYAQVSLAIGKNIAYLQQYIKNGSPRRLGEVERHKLAQILHVDEQELTDLPLNITTYSAATVNSEILSLIIENIESWLSSHDITMSPHDKAELIKLIYTKVCADSLDIAAGKVRDFIEIYNELRKVD